MPRFLLADDHPVTRRGLKEILLEAFPFAEIQAVTNAEELMSHVMMETWDLVVTDISMPGRSGLDVLTELNKEFPKLPVLVLSIHPEEEYAVRVIKAGGSAYLVKDSHNLEGELVEAVEVVLRGRKYITPSVAEKLANEVAQDAEKKPHETLSDREFHVFKLLAQGKTTGEISVQLALSVNTIGTFRRRIMTKMSMKTNAEIVAYAIRKNLI